MLTILKSWGRWACRLAAAGVGEVGGRAVGGYKADGGGEKERGGRRSGNRRNPVEQVILPAPAQFNHTKLFNLISLSLYVIWFCYKKVPSRELVCGIHEGLPFWFRHGFAIAVVIKSQSWRFFFSYNYLQVAFMDVKNAMSTYVIFSSKEWVASIAMTATLWIRFSDTSQKDDIRKGVTRSQSFKHCWARVADFVPARQATLAQPMQPGGPVP